MAKVTVCTQCYNTLPYLEQCVNSVLSQTFSDFEYVIIDSASTDGSGELLEEFAKRDKRIRLIRLQENQFAYWMSILPQIATSPYFALIDSDDWWELEYLETLVSFLEENNLDIAYTGRIEHYIDEQREWVYKESEPLILTQKEFAKRYAHLHYYANINWGSISKRELLLTPEIESINRRKYSIYEDGMMRHQYLMQCRKIGIHNSNMYHYIIHSKSQTHRYMPDNLRCLVDMSDMRREFLKRNGALTLDIQNGLKTMYLWRLQKLHIWNLRDAELPADDKIAECDRALNHPKTLDALSFSCKEREELRNAIWEILLQPGMTEKSDIHLQHIAPLLLSQYPELLQRENIELLQKTPLLLKALQNNSRIVLFDELMNLFRKNPEGRLSQWETVLLSLFPKGWPLDVQDSLKLFERSPSLFKALQANNRIRLFDEVILLARQTSEEKRDGWEEVLHHLFPQTWISGMITDYRFFWEHEEISRLLFKGDMQAALKQMSCQLAENNSLYNRELFVELYLALFKTLQTKSRIGMFDDILHRARKASGEKCAEWGSLLHELFPKGWVSDLITDYRFFWEHGEVISLLYQGSIQAALQLMTRQLTEGTPLYDKELFLNLYLSLAAVSGRAPEFIRGKVEAAKFYCGENRLEDCRKALADLEDMGQGDGEELAGVRRFCSSGELIAL